MFESFSKMLGLGRYTLVEDETIGSRAERLAQEADTARQLAKATGYDIDLKKIEAEAKLAEFFRAKKFSPLTIDSVTRYKAQRIKPSPWARFKLSAGEALEKGGRIFTEAPLGFIAFIGGVVGLPYILAKILDYILWYEIDVAWTFLLFLLPWILLTVMALDDDYDSGVDFHTFLGAFIFSPIWFPIAYAYFVIFGKFESGKSWEMKKIKNFQGKLNDLAKSVAFGVKTLLPESEIYIEELVSKTASLNEGFVVLRYGQKEPVSVYLRHYVNSD